MNRPFQRSSRCNVDIDRDGASHYAGMAKAMLPELCAVLAKWPDGCAGTRIAGDAELARILASGGPLGAAVAKNKGCEVRPVRAVLFDKNDRADWSLGWHQDRTVAVQDRKELAGFGPWTVKQGIQHVEPPFSVIEGMVTVRIHIDTVDNCNAPLLIARGSHLLGRIPVNEVAAVVARSSVHGCLAEAGDVWFYRTPILHASDAARPGRRRRVLQVDYAAGDLPAPLDWSGIRPFEHARKMMYNTPEDRPVYRLLTGKDDRAFCERVSEALEQGWRLYGSPSLSWDTAENCMKAAQAVVWHEANVVK